MTNKDKIFSELDHLWDHFFVLADIYEEEGDQVRANGFRYLARHKKFPKFNGFGWVWSYGYSQQNCSYYLPRKVYVLLPKGRWRRQLSTSCAAAAWAFGVGIKNAIIKE